MNEISISLKSDVIVELFGVIPITNSVLAAVFTSLLLILVALIVRAGSGIVPSKLQLIAEMTVGYFNDQMKVAYKKDKRAKMLLPFYLTMFLFLIFVNQFSVLPLVNQLVVEGTSGDIVSLFRTGSTDLSLPLAMALFVVITSQVWAFAMHPIRHVGNYFRFHEFFKIRKLGDIPFAFIEFFLGLLDIIGEIAKVVSLSARLFGNIFAGEVMYLVIINLAVFTQFVLPIPFVVLSIFSGFVQAYVFAFLTLQFMAITLAGVEPDEQPKEVEATATA